MRSLRRAPWLLLMLLACLLGGCSSPRSEPATWTNCAENPKSSAACRLCLMGGEWRIVDVSGAPSFLAFGLDRPPRNTDYLGFEPVGRSIHIADDEFTFVYAHDIRRRKRTSLLFDGNVQRIYLQHDVDYDPGWSAAGFVTQTGNQMELCLGADPADARFLCPPNALHVELRRNDVAPQCDREPRPTVMATTWAACGDDPKTRSRCRLRLMAGTWRIEQTATPHQYPYFERHRGKSVSIVQDDFRYGEYGDDWVTHKQITLPAGGNQQKLVLKHDINNSKGWSSQGLVSQEGELMYLCFGSDFSDPVRFYCPDEAENVVLRRIRGGP